MLVMQSLQVLVWLAFATIARADPTIVLDRQVPFSEDDLRDAVKLRMPRGTAQIVVTTGPAGELLITADGRSETIVTPERDPRASVRVVAMVVVGLLEVDASRASRQASDDEPPHVVRTPGSTPVASRISLRLRSTRVLDDNDYSMTLHTGSILYRVSEHARLAATAGYGNLESAFGVDRIVPVRLGIEGTAGAIGFELGGIAIPYARHAQCEVSDDGNHQMRDTSGVAHGLYGAVRTYVPVASGVRLVFEYGRYLLRDLGQFTSDGCVGRLNWQENAQWLGAGLEWVH